MCLDKTAESSAGLEQTKLHTFLLGLISGSQPAEPASDDGDPHLAVLS
jgi:hypothetical protein